MDADTMINEFISLESELTIFELRLLLRLATGLENEMGPHEPIWPHTGMTLETAPFLAEYVLLEMARQQRLVRLGLITLHPGENDAMRLTPRGLEAVNWWVGALEDLGFKHEVLAAD